MVSKLRQFIYRARAPLRVSFGGGGSELPPYVNTYGGVVLNATINRHAYATIAAAEDDMITFTAADCDISETMATTHPLPVEGKLPLHRAVYNRIIKAHNGGKPFPLHLRTYNEAPVGSGLGSSSTLTVAMVRCFEKALDLNFDEYTLAALAHNIERVDLGLSGGYQDHYAAAFGGFNLIEFHADGTVVVNALRLRDDILAELEYSLLLYFTGVSRESANIINEQTKGITNKREVIETMHRLKKNAYQMKDCLMLGQLNDFASSLHESWILKQSTAATISNDDINRTYQTALEHGALGGKISGAGGGGFMMLLIDPDRRREIIAHLPNAKQQAISCYFSRGGAAAWRISVERKRGE